ncbi:MAG: cytochrome c oxidase subunit II [Candidatus Dadabacteria bacterium]
MKIDPFEKLAMIGGGVLLAIFLLAIIYANFDLSIKIPTCEINTKPFTSGAVIETSPKSYEVHVVARMWFFDFGENQNEITISTGSRVTFFLTSADVIHGFKIINKDINMMAMLGVIGRLETTFDKPGEYLIVCHEYCGIGHQGMYGKIKVTE